MRAHCGGHVYQVGVLGEGPRPVVNFRALNLGFADDLPILPIFPTPPSFPILPLTTIPTSMTACPTGSDVPVPVGVPVDWLWPGLPPEVTIPLWTILPPQPGPCVRDGQQNLPELVFPAAGGLQVSGWDWPQGGCRCVGGAGGRCDPSMQGEEPGGGEQAPLWKVGTAQ